MVKPEQIKARLKVKYPKANLSLKRLDAIAAKLAPKPEDGADDEAIDLILEAANDFISFEEIAREDDRIRTLEANQKPKTDPPAPTDLPTPLPKPEDDAPAWAKPLLESNKKLSEEIEALKTGKVTESKKQTVTDLFEKSEVLKNLKPEVKKRWLDRVNVDSETPFEDQIKELESEYSELVQISADANDYAGPAGSGGSDLKPDSTMIDEIVGNYNI